MPIRAVRIVATGVVQGWGVRPAVARLAKRLALSGSVANTQIGLQIELVGPGESVELFLSHLRETLPSGARVEQVTSEPTERHTLGEFVIRPSSTSGSLSAAVPSDRNVCDTCRDETLDAANRRHDYPFTSCTQCGPRYSIISAMPYDRSATTLNSFRLCAQCADEYASADDRRFHAQTNACLQCGPRVTFVDHAGQLISADNTTALALATAALLAGQIVALQGIGGYQLLVDATQQSAIERLRDRKGRRTKPLAVMVRDLQLAERVALLHDAERRWLADPSGPIVVATRRGENELPHGSQSRQTSGSSQLDTPRTLVSSATSATLTTQVSASAVSPALPTIGLMLPTTPLHVLLCEQVGRPLVVTSGNREGDPLPYDTVSAERQLAGIADWFVHHNRPIVRPIDDSVLRVTRSAAPCVLRLGRGLAPLVLPPLATSRPIIALGGEQKSAIALSNGVQAILGPHIGELTQHATCTRWHEQLAALAVLYGVSLAEALVVHDAHPDYFTTQWATQQAAQRHSVQHHHAHIAAVMHEHGLHGDVLGLAWDGTGYGPDGMIWGGEALLASRSQFRRVAHLRPFALVGGERAIREPWRVALVMLAEAVGSAAIATLDWPNVPLEHRSQVLNVQGNASLAVRSTSMGRLFDAVACLTLGITHADDDGRPAMLLESVVDRHALGSYRLPWDPATGVADWRPLIVDVWRDVQQRTSAEVIALRFHRTLVDWAEQISAAYAKLPLVSGGGVFQNACLHELFAERFVERPQGWYAPRMVPPGDGGLAVGQLAVAAARLHDTCTGDDCA